MSTRERPAGTTGRAVAAVAGADSGVVRRVNLRTEAAPSPHLPAVAASCTRGTEMPAELQSWLVATAAALAPRLARDWEAIGPTWFPEREDHGPAAFLARAVVGQQISARAARSIWARLEAQAGHRGSGLGDFLAGADETVLRACGLSGNKVKAVLSIHEAAAEGELAALAGLDHAERSERLCRIWGIGPWTSDMLALFYLREPDIWPEGDLAVQRVFRSYIGRRKPAKAAQSFAPWRSLLALAMWRLVTAQWQ